MAKLVGAFASSHGPLIARNWEGVGPERLELAKKSFAELGKRFTACKPDVLIVVSPDHWVNFFINNLPSVCIGIGESHEGSPEPWLKLPFDEFPGHPQFANHLAQTALQQDFEPSLSHRLKLDHGFMIPLWKMGLTKLPAIVPIIVNIIEPPMPSFRRCFAWGELIKRAIDSYPENIRVAILATGGLSHSIGEPDMGRLDEEYDRECLAHFTSSDVPTLLQFLDQRTAAAGNGAEEIRNWLVAHATAGARGFDVIGYHAYKEWYIGSGFASWNLAG
ncbi:MAG: 2,3-dihydroxyphenylpropionate 1,2-dioxygenase [Burkholderiales bacterium]